VQLVRCSGIPRFCSFILIGILFSLGKSTVTIQFVENHFVDAYHPTIENTFHKVIKYGNDEFLTEIVDTAGQVSTPIIHISLSILIFRFFSFLSFLDFFVDLG
jgi:hypothetical protein